MKIYRLTATELRVLLHQREISSEQIISSLFERITAVDGRLKAFICTCRDRAMEQARLSDNRRLRGQPTRLLEGLPIAVKDNICTRDLPTTCASRILQSFCPPYDAHVIEKIKHHGGIIIGKTNMDEFAMGSSCENSAFFASANPWNLDYVPGGSSGGSACAVAAGITPLALGSDTGGSIRQPACFCGVVGLKPTYGRVSRYGLVAFASSLDQIGTLTRSVEDAALLLEAIAGPDHRDATSALQPPENYSQKMSPSLHGKKIGIVAECFSQGIDPSVSSACTDAIATLERAGAQIHHVSLPHTSYAIATYYLLATAQASSNLARYDGVHYGYRMAPSPQGVQPEDSALDTLYLATRSNGFGREVKLRILLGTFALASGYYQQYYAKALATRAMIKEEVSKALSQVDVLLTPTSPIPAFKRGEKIEDPLAMYLCDIFTVTFSLSGHPAISIPCGLTPDGLPIGMQMVGKEFAEQTLLQVAYAYQQHGGFPILPEKEP